MTCHKGDSHNIYLKVKPVNASGSDYLEAELQAAGVKICGELTQRRPMASQELPFFWNCNFETPGTHLVNLLLRVTTKEGEVKRDVLRKSHEIQVITLYRQYGTTLVTTIVTVLTYLVSLNINNVASAFQYLLPSLHF